MDSFSYVNLIKTNEKLFILANTSLLTIFISWLHLDLGVYRDLLFRWSNCLQQDMAAVCNSFLYLEHHSADHHPRQVLISDRVAKVMGNNSVPVLATLFLLSYSKLYRTIIKARNWSTIMISPLLNSEAVWSADGNLEYLHSPLFVVAVGTLLFLWLPYTLLLFLGQWLHRCNSKLIVRMLSLIKPFLDAPYSPLNGNHRYWFRALLLVTATILLLSALVPADRSSVVVLSVALSAVVVICFQLLVYRNVTVAIFNASFSVNLAFLCILNLLTTTIAGSDFRNASNTLIGLAFIQFCRSCPLQILFLSQTG